MEGAAGGSDMTDAEEAEFLSILVAAAQVGPGALSPWQQSFLHDLEIKYQQSLQDSTDMTLTHKQWAALRTIQDKV